MNILITGVNGNIGSELYSSLKDKFTILSMSFNQGNMKKNLNMKKVKIICTLGPASFSKTTLKLLSKEKVDIFRINLSHTYIQDLKDIIKMITDWTSKTISLDTENSKYS